MIAEKNFITKSDLRKMFDEYYDALVKYANRFLGLNDECQDLVQDVFVSLWEKENIFPDEISLKIFLYKSVRNKCYDVIKHNKVKDKYAENIVKSIEDDDLFLEEILKEEIVRKLHDAIELLPDRKKEIIKLSLKGFKNNEIADCLEIKLQTVKTLKSQSYKILRDQFLEFDTIIYFLLV
ncbi:hypothetical protein B6A10_11700 [Flavobacterium sp. L1I52]|uniref:RNA polymerase sigma-70 factor n=2 Tax=Flavobacterium pokkalii TaxID=1940408 RepID=A0ABR7USI4_9FLAO|nr:hypothetical protein [Flavobacterium pokkalii]